MGWYRQGTVSIENGETAVTGALTGWTSQAKAEDRITFDGGAKWYEIASVESNTGLTLATPFEETTVSGGAYAIDRAGRSWNITSDLAARIAALLAMFPVLGGVGDAFKYFRSNEAGTAFEFASDLDTFEQAGTGAVTRTLQGKARDAVSVLDFIPVAEHAAILAHTSTTDVVTYIQAAIDAMPAAGGGVSFPAGKYRVSSAILVNKTGVLFCDGMGSATIETSSATDAIMTISAEFVEVRGFTYRCSTTRTGGDYVEITGNRVLFRDFYMSGAYGGINTSGTGVTIETGYLFDGIAAVGVGIIVTDGFDVTIRDVIMDAASNLDAGIRITNAGDVTIEDCNIINAGNALHILPTTGETVASVWANNCFFDTSTRGALLDSTGGSVVRCIFDQCWFSSHTQSGVTLSKSSGSGTLTGVEFNGCHIFDNDSHGVHVFDPAWEDVTWNGCIIAGNGGNGISIPANFSKFAILGCRIGPASGMPANANGIVIAAGTSNNFVISDNNLLGNTGAALTNGGTGTTRRISGNLPETADQAWISYTPTITANAGTFTSVSAEGKYSHVGNGSIEVWIRITITTNGTAATAIRATLPIASVNSDVLFGRENQVTGNLCSGTVSATGTTLVITKYDGTYPGADGYVIVMHGTYEV